MSEFPPFKPRAAAPKGQASRPMTIEEAATLPSADREMTSAQAEVHEQVEALLDLGEDEAPLDVRLQRITVCAKCGSREVREAILVDGEVYVKL